MKTITNRTKRIILLSLLASLALSVILSACAGGAQINFTYNPTTGVGSGNIQLTAPAGGQATSAPSGGGGSAATSQLVLFGVVVALLIGVLAVVVASSRRRRIE